MQIENPENKDRIVSAEWAGNEFSREMFEATINVTAHNSITIVADLTAAVAEMRVSLLSINMQNVDNEITISLTVGCRNTEHLQQIMSRMRAIRDVETVTR